LIAHLNSPMQAATWLQSRVTGRLTTDSRDVADGDGFIAWPGAQTDGRCYVAVALAVGAPAILVEHKDVESFDLQDGPIATYTDLKQALGPIASNYYDAPSENLAVVAVTGTNGKTSTTWLFAQALSKLGQRCGIVGTLGIGEPGVMKPNGLTTPDPVRLHGELRRFVDQGFSACAIEASSIGLVEHRLDALAIRVAVFTNFTQDHLDFHLSMETYWKAKRALFYWPGLRAVVLNIDDAKGAELAAELHATDLDVWTCSLKGPARIRASNIAQHANGLAFEVVEEAENAQEGMAFLLETQMVGEYNVANLIGVVAAMRALQIPLAQAVAACTNLRPIPGRMELLASPNAPLVVIDYAHTPDALEKVLTALKPVARARGGRLCCMFGCGGDRDRTKRPQMAAIAERHADHVMLTSDNPRLEPPMAIIEDVMRGFAEARLVKVEPDRATAIALVLKMAAAQDVVVLAGKGHEPYQDIGGVKRAYSDRAEADAALAARASAGGAP
jgi:UDP-N-acetylmuramoyl-L-alanyl-D-glutamate--2,6-diaminopimelate ligase